jgi:hypothetical protein
MLRASATATDQPADLVTVQDPDADGGVRAAPELAALVGAVVADRGGESARAEAVEAVGAGGTVDAVAVVANFEMMTRIADGTGAAHETVDPEVARSTGADRFPSAL